MAKTKEKMDVAQIVTKRIMDKLEAGVIPWKKPWTGIGVARRWSVNKPYRGINMWLLDAGEYASLKQIEEAGGKIKPEERKNWHLVVYWHWYDVKDPGQEGIPDEDCTYTERATPFYSRVWEINTQCEGLESKVEIEDRLDFNPVEEAEALIAKYKNKPDIKKGGGRAAYSPIFDYIQMPLEESFHSIEEYYCTLFHELVHSTGHVTRLRRQDVIDAVRFGSETYAKEELVAEMGASMLCSLSGIDNSALNDNSAAYIHGWLKKLQGDKRFIFSAASQAQNAVDYMIGTNNEEEPEKLAEEEALVTA